MILRAEKSWRCRYSVSTCACASCVSGCVCVRGEPAIVYRSIQLAPHTADASWWLILVESAPKVQISNLSPVTIEEGSSLLFVITVWGCSVALFCRQTTTLSHVLQLPQSPPIWATSAVLLSQCAWPPGGNSCSSLLARDTWPDCRPVQRAEPPSSVRQCHLVVTWWTTWSGKLLEFNRFLIGFLIGFKLKRSRRFPIDCPPWNAHEYFLQ